MADTKRIILPPALGCFTWLAKPRPPMKNATNPRSTYQLVLIWKKSDRAKLAELEAAIKAASVEKFGANPKGRIKMPIRDGDTERPGYPEFKDSVFVTVSSERRPPIVDAQRNPVLDPGEDAYSGCTFRASVHVFGYDVEANRGISVGLDALQVVRKGERLGGAGMSEEAAAEEFKDYNDGGDDLV